MRPIGTAKVLEKRRLHAIAFLQKGYRPCQVAEMVGVDRRSVRRWNQAFREQGGNGLLAQPHPGKPAKLLEKQKEVLIKELLKGAQAQGYSTDLWTCPRIAQVIRRKFGISYHIRYIGRLLGTMNWSCQKPEGRALERNERDIQRWARKEWPRIKKSPASACNPCFC